MKKILVLCLLAPLLLTGCGQTATETAPTTQAAAETAPAATEPTETQVSVPATGSSGRPLHAEMEFYPEGMSELCPVTLYEGQGYSIYIPDGDFKMAEDGHWIAALNDRVEFEVVFYPGVTEDDLRTAVTPAPLTQCEDGIWTMYTQDGDSWDAPCMDLWLHPAEDGVYALYSRYFLEAAEGFGLRMIAVAASFEIAK